MDRQAAALWRDPLFFLAVAVAPLYWAVLFAQTQPALDPAWPLREFSLFVFPALIYPLAEEVIFRGLIQDLAHQHLKPWRLKPFSHANVMTSLLFTALHFIHHPPLWAAAVFAPSLIFGFFKDRTGRLTAPILLHVFYNTGYFWIFAAP